RPAASAALMVAALVPGRTTKNWLNDSDDPAAVRPNHVVPDELVRSDGTNTRYSPAAVTYRTDFCGTTAVCTITVWDGFGKCAGGAPTTPGTTMFHTNPDQPLPNSL